MDKGFKCGIFKLTALAFCFNEADDTGKYSGITVEAVKDAIVRRDIFYYLQKNLGDESECLSIFSVADMQELNEEWAGYVQTLSPNRFEFCMNRSGLRLLIAYLLAGIQERVPFDLGESAVMEPWEMGRGKSPTKN